MSGFGPWLTATHSAAMSASEGEPTQLMLATEGSLSSSHLTHLYGPAVRSKRFVDQVVSGLASMYPAFDWSIFSGPPWISARVRSH